jgi:coproporphyrinogen III oxidase-like Fe-S oxidoreductase
VGLGAGAHGKLSYADRVMRHERPKPPREYLAQAGTLRETPVPPRELPFEFMLNALRLVDGLPATYFEQRTGLPRSTVARRLADAQAAGLIEPDPTRIRPTPRGRLFLNELLQRFLD